jgi:hypothetical protein
LRAAVLVDVRVLFAGLNLRFRVGEIGHKRRRSAV